MAESFSDLKELLSFGTREIGVMDEILEVIYACPKHFVISNVELMPTKPTGELRLSYQLADSLKALLLALRAEDAKSEDGKKGLIHVFTPNVQVKAAPPCGVEP